MEKGLTPIARFIGNRRCENVGGPMGTNSKQTIRLELYEFTLEV